MLAVPFAVLLVGTVLVPVLYALYLSLFTERLQGLGFSGPEHVFVWLGNYVSVIADTAFHASLGNVALFALVHIPSMLIGSLVLALLLDSARRAAAADVVAGGVRAIRGAGGHRRSDLGLPLQPHASARSRTCWASTR